MLGLLEHALMSLLRFVVRELHLVTGWLFIKDVGCVRSFTEGAHIQSAEQSGEAGVRGAEVDGLLGLQTEEHGVRV